MIFFWVWQGLATERYVATNGLGESTGPFTDWSTAGTNIRTVVDWANSNNAGDIVWVSNGTYQLSEQISITNTQLKSWNNNPLNTIIDGGNYPGRPTTNRCLYLDHASALVCGFTISNGFQYQVGGGVYINNGILTLRGK